MRCSPGRRSSAASPRSDARASDRSETGRPRRVCPRAGPPAGELQAGPRARPGAGLKARTSSPISPTIDAALCPPTDALRRDGDVCRRMQCPRRCAEVSSPLGRGSVGNHPRRGAASARVVSGADVPPDADSPFASPVVSRCRRTILLIKHSSAPKSEGLAANSRLTVCQYGRSLHSCFAIASTSASNRVVFAWFVGESWRRQG